MVTKGPSACCALLKDWFIADLFLCELLLLWLEVSYQIAGSLLLGKVQGQWEGKVEPIFPATTGEAGMFRSWLCCSRSAEGLKHLCDPCHTGSHGQQLQSVLLSSLLLLLALYLKTNQHWSLRRKKGGGKGTPIYFKWQAEAAQSPVPQVLLLMFHSLLLAVPAVQCQHLWMCLLPVALPCVWCSCRGTHSIDTFLAGMLQSHKLPCGSCVFIDRYSKWARCFCCVSPLGYSSHLAASTSACQDLLLLHFLNPLFCSRLVKHR